MLWLKIIWFFGWQALLAMVLVGWQRKILRRARSGEDLPSPRAFHVFVQLYFCLPWLLAGWIALQASRRSGFSGAGASDFPFVFGAIIIPQLLLHLALYGHLSRLGLGVREITPTRRDVQLVWIGILQSALISAMVSFVILVLGFQVPRAVMGVGFGVFLLAVVGLHRARTTLTRARPSRAVEMEDSPLRSEILAVAAAFGWQPQTVLVRPLKRTSEGGELSPTEMLLTLQLWWQRFDPRQPVIPVELLQQVDPDGVTAAVAVRYARLVDPFPGGLHRLRSSRPGGLLLVGAALLLIAFMALAVGAALGLDQNALFILVCLFFPVLYWAAFSLRNRNAIVRGFGAWRNGDPSGERTPEDFIAALALYDRLASGLDRPDMLITFYRSSAGVKRFLARFGEETAERAFQRARLAAEQAGAAAGGAAPQAVVERPAGRA